MKRACISLIALLCVFMTACVSNAKYNALEERVAALEKIHGIKVVDDKKTESKTKSGKNTYPINKKTEQEIYEEILTILQNKPSQGQTVDDYAKVLGGKPVKNIFAGGVYGSLRFYFQENLDDAPQKDQITYVGVSGVYQNMDGSIGISNKTDDFYSYVAFSLMDYDRAAKVYDLLFDELSKQYSNTMNDQYEHTKWRAIGSPEKDGNSTYFLSLEKKEEYYVLNALYLFK